MGRGGRLIQRARASFDRVDRRVTGWMARHGLTLLRWSVGVGGVPDFFPGI